MKKSHNSFKWPQIKTRPEVYSSVSSISYSVSTLVNKIISQSANLDHSCSPRGRLVSPRQGWSSHIFFSWAQIRARVSEDLKLSQLQLDSDQAEPSHPLLIQKVSSWAEPSQLELAKKIPIYFFPMLVKPETWFTQIITPLLVTPSVLLNHLEPLWITFNLYETQVNGNLE